MIDAIFQKSKSIFIHHKFRGGYETIKVNIKNIIRFNFQYEIGDALAKLYMFINQKLDINIKKLIMRNKVNESIIEPFTSIQECLVEDNQGVKVTIHHKAVYEIIAVWEINRNTIRITIE
jgi:hypothetical protein